MRLQGLGGQVGAGDHLDAADVPPPDAQVAQQPLAAAAGPEHPQQQQLDRPVPARLPAGQPASDADHDAVAEVGQQHRHADRAPVEVQRHVHQEEQQPPLVEQDALVTGRLAPVPGGHQRDDQQTGRSDQRDGCERQDHRADRGQPRIAQPQREPGAAGQRDPGDDGRRREQRRHGAYRSGGHRQHEQHRDQRVRPPPDEDHGEAEHGAGAARDDGDRGVAEGQQHARPPAQPGHDDHRDDQWPAELEGEHHDQPRVQNLLVRQVLHQRRDQGRDRAGSDVPGHRPVQPGPGPAGQRAARCASPGRVPQQAGRARRSRPGRQRGWRGRRAGQGAHRPADRAAVAGLDQQGQRRAEQRGQQQAEPGAALDGGPHEGRRTPRRRKYDQGV